MLPNHSRTMRSDMDPRAPGSKYLRTDMGPYPGGVQYLTPNYINNDKQVNKTPGRKVNGSIRTTIHTRTRDQNYINVDQFCFIDVRNRKLDRPVLYNLQTVNWILTCCDAITADAHPISKALHNSYGSPEIRKYLKDGATLVDAEKAYILESLKLYGVVVNRDVDNDESVPTERIARTFTTTVKNVCHVLDYFSTKKNVLKPYDSCFFVLKKIKLTAGDAYENVITRGRSAAIKKVVPVGGRWVWQIIPYHTSTGHLPLEVRTWTEPDSTDEVDPATNEHYGVTYTGAMWKLGKIHEYPDICITSAFEKRTSEMAVARNVSILHGYGRITPIHFYLTLQPCYY